MRPRSAFALLRSNPAFRYLWGGQVVSQLGDWFNAIAVYALLLELTGSATAVASMMVVQNLPNALLAPWAGAIVDRFDRRRVMIAADVVRACVILGLLFVHRAEQIWMAYTCVGAAVLATAFFEPARSAILPSLVDRDDLLTANALSSATWSVMLAIGASLGGLVAHALGREFAFILNAVSFAVSAVLLSRITVVASPQAHLAPADRRTPRIREGLEYLRHHRPVLAYLSIKGLWALAGGMLLLLTVFGQRVFRIGDSADAGIGVLYAARGLGALIGAWCVNTRLGQHTPRLLRSVGPSFACVGVCYASVALAPSLWWAALGVVGAHTAGSVLWVASTVLLQLHVPDRLRGRVFALDFSLLTLVSAVSGYTTAFVLDHTSMGPRPLAAALASLFIVPALVWWHFARRPVSPVPRA